MLSIALGAAYWRLRRYRFDFPVLLAKVVRHELPLSPFRQWLFVDTLAILEAAKEEVGPCRKLQCLVRHYADPTDLRAHRAALFAANAFLVGPFGPFIHPAIFRPAVGP